MVMVIPKIRVEVSDEDYDAVMKHLSREGFIKDKIEVNPKKNESEFIDIKIVSISIDI